MALPRFVHLRIHSEFSITDGVVRIDDAVAAADAQCYRAKAMGRDNVQVETLVAGDVEVLESQDGAEGGE